MKHVVKLIAVVSLAATLTSISMAVEVLTNGNLDLTHAVEINPPAPGFFLPKPLGWQNEGFRSVTGPYEDEMSSEPWAGPAPTPVTMDGNANQPHPEGCGGPDCAVFFKPFSGNTANGLATGHLYQDNPALPGQRYTLTGWAGAEANVLVTDAEFAIEFFDAGNAMLGGATLSLLPTLFVNNGEAFNYKEYTLSATAPGNAAIVRARASMIGASGNPAGGGQALVIDDFSLSVVPEPATAMLFTIGALGLLGIARRR